MEVRVDDWSELKFHAGIFRGWMFRGQASALWSLQTSLERLVESNRYPFDQVVHGETKIIREFMRRAHLVMPSPPAEDAWLEWMAAIQHYGGPTRLLDFTHSLYVASFFALESAADDAAVWALDSRRLDQSHGLPKYESDTTRRARYEQLAASVLSSEHPAAGVLPIEPYRFNDRMAVQKGLFLFPIDATQTFIQNLEISLGSSVGPDAVQTTERRRFQEYVANDRDRQTISMLKMILPRGIRREALDDLDDMNVHAAALFPGLDGVARSLQRYLRCW